MKENESTLYDFIKNNSNNHKQNILGEDLSSLTKIIESLDEKPFRAKQLYNWIYRNGITDFTKINNIAKTCIQKMIEGFSIQRPKIKLHLKSKDGTEKWVLKFRDYNEAEMVFIPEKNRGTLCISSQVGCTLNCKFCHTGTQRLVRNLTSSEIVGQVMLAKDTLEDWKNEKTKITNIVFMGMGEPLFNTDNVIKALKTFTSDHGLGLSRKKVTVSTSGIVPEIDKLAKEVNTALAVSLHSANDITRTSIMPINKKYNLNILRESCKNYCKNSNSDKITWEYVMLKGINDSLKDADDLIEYIKDIPSKVNIIPFNPWDGTNYTCSNKEVINNFVSKLQKANIVCPIRRARGDDIMAACGQLKTISEKIRKNTKQ